MAKDTEKDIGKAYIKNVRLSYPHLAKPHASVKDGPLKFRATFLMDPSTPEGKKAVAQCKAAAERICKEAWPKAKKPPIKADRKCLKKGDEFVSATTGEVKEGYDGQVVLTTSSDDRPLVLHRNKKPIGESDINRILYAGCRVEAMVRFYAITDPDKGGNGLFATVEGVRFFADDESFGRQAMDADEFDDLNDDEGFDDDEDDDDADDDDEVI